MRIKCVNLFISLLSKSSVKLIIAQHVTTFATFLSLPYCIDVLYHFILNLRFEIMAERYSLEQETVQYYNWLMRLEHAEFEKELLEIVSIHFYNVQIRNNFIQ